MHDVETWPIRLFVRKDGQIQVLLNYVIGMRFLIS